MKYDFLVDNELDRVDWAHVQEASGPAISIPLNFRELLAARDEEEVKRAYWKLENHVVVQGHLYEAAIYLVPVICAALVDPDRPRLIRSWIIELLFQICNGYYLSTPDSASRPVDIVTQCRNAARNALWLLYGELARQEIKIVESLVALLENDPDRLLLLKKRIPNYKAPVWTTKSH
jgi:hypothetical protein